MIVINTSDDKLKEQLILVIKLFLNKSLFDTVDMQVDHKFDIKKTKLITIIEVKFLNKTYIKRTSFTLKNNLLKPEKHYIEMHAKILLYKILSKIFNQKMPWGALTGIRPSKLFADKVYEYRSIKKAKKVMKSVYLVSTKRIGLLTKIFDLQKKSIENIEDKFVDFYVNIPFCTSRCYYCSFLSATTDKCGHLIEPYVKALEFEIKESLKFLKSNKFIIRNIYFGGGTPTAIPLNQLEKILKLMPKANEFTVEAGRPDTISEDTFKLFKKYGVTRVSVNPQTFNDDTLKRIGRKHNSQDVIDKYNLAKKYGFIVNMDLIAGLDNENLKDFTYSLNQAINLNPDNITVHTLCYKRTSTLNLSGGVTSSEKETGMMVDYSIEKLISSGYAPYYLYKQKNTISNLENVGYCKIGTQCLFNINSMEECSSIFACGANGISKRLYSESNKIERWANVKNIEEYISRIDEMINKKFDLFK